MVKAFSIVVACMQCAVDLGISYQSNVGNYINWFEFVVTRTLLNSQGLLMKTTYSLLMTNGYG
jgi:hypothetical protein